MLKKISSTFLIFIFLFFIKNFALSDIYIYATVDDEIITNHDIYKESEYLKILNPNLSELDKNKILELAKNSLINEIIKKKEISKYIDIEKDNPFVDDYLNDIAIRLNLENKDNLIIKLKEKKNYSLDEIQKKIKIELFWNDLIYSRYSKQVKIDEKKLKDKIENIQDENRIEYYLSEIVFNKKKEQTLDQITDQIKLSINEIGFNNTANIYSISKSSKFGGKLGWINKNNLSKQIIQKLEDLDEGQFTDIIKIKNNYLILKIDKIRITQIEINKENELQKLIKAETNKQLNQFSRIYFDKSKINYKIDEK